MSFFIVNESGPLKGEVEISGAKNAALPILAACMLTDEQCVIKGVPPLMDVLVMLDILKSIGAQTTYENETASIRFSQITKNEVDNALASSMRASFLIMGPMLARSGEAKIPLPGGCKIGTRPVDLHIKGMEILGAKIIQEHGFVTAKAGKLKGDYVYLDFPSVGATENIMTAACVSEGVTLIENAAEEPEIHDLAMFLNKMGANIKMKGSGKIKITGVQKLCGAEYTVMPDRIETGTFMAAAAVTGGDIIIKNAVFDHVQPACAKLAENGTITEKIRNGIHVYSTGEKKAFSIKTMPFPGFPTDMQAIFMSVMAISKGTSIVTETVFENRFLQAAELKRMGADIKTDGRTAVVEGVDGLTGAKVNAPDLRAGAALVIAALSSRGMTEIGEIQHIERGYCDFDKKLKSLGADIKKTETKT